MIDTQQYIKLNIRGEISRIVVQAHSGRKRDINVQTHTHIYIMMKSEKKKEKKNLAGDERRTLYVIQLSDRVYNGTFPA